MAERFLRKRKFSIFTKFKKSFFRLKLLPVLDQIRVLSFGKTLDIHLYSFSASLNPFYLSISYNSTHPCNFTAHAVPDGCKVQQVTMHINLVSFPVVNKEKAIEFSASLHLIHIHKGPIRSHLLVNNLKF